MNCLLEGLMGGDGRYVCSERTAQQKGKKKTFYLKIYFKLHKHVEKTC